ncbi:MAG TPA: hypothetical protein DHW02_06075 [Ktedonobacter sp.]|nr:hypothetical protein [Ktedonobacter sp.]
MENQQRIGFLVSKCLLFLCVLSLCLSSCTLPFGNQNTTSTSTHLVMQQPPASRLTYTAIGASDTFGIGTDDPQSESWPADLAGRLGNGVHLVNLGVPSIDARDALNVEVPVAIDSHPNIITIWLAVNDIADNIPVASYEHDLDLVLTRLQAGAPHAIIVVANVPDLTYLPHFQSYDVNALHALIASYNNAIANVVASHHVLLVDLISRWQQLATHPEYISDDGFHPNALGYTVLAGLFYQVLQEHGDVT